MSKDSPNTHRTYDDKTCTRRQMRDVIIVDSSDPVGPAKVFFRNHFTSRLRGPCDPVVWPARRQRVYGCTFQLLRKSYLSALEYSLVQSTMRGRVSQPI
ncbi:hypothetical protein MPTK2_2g90310P [Marchantia polymorpha subsp. ruderalis]